MSMGKEGFRRCRVHDSAVSDHAFGKRAAGALGEVQTSG